METIYDVVERAATRRKREEPAGKGANAKRQAKPKASARKPAGKARKPSAKKAAGKSRKR